MVVVQHEYKKNNMQKPSESKKAKRCNERSAKRRKGKKKSKGGYLRVFISNISVLVSKEKIWGAIADVLQYTLNCTAVPRCAQRIKIPSEST